MLVLALLVASRPTIVCAICSAFQAYKDKAAMDLVRRAGSARRNVARRVAPASPARMTSPRGPDRVARRYWLVRP
jgi:cation transport regulator ChaB